MFVNPLCLTTGSKKSNCTA